MSANCSRIRSLIPFSFILILIIILSDVNVCVRICGRFPDWDKRVHCIRFLLYYIRSCRGIAYRKVTSSSSACGGKASSPRRRASAHGTLHLSRGGGEQRAREPTSLSVASGGSRCAGEKCEIDSIRRRRWSFNKECRISRWTADSDDIAHV